MDFLLQCAVVMITPPFKISLSKLITSRINFQFLHTFNIPLASANYA